MAVVIFRSFLWLGSESSGWGTAPFSIPYVNRCETACQIGLTLNCAVGHRNNMIGRAGQGRAGQGRASESIGQGGASESIGPGQTH